MSDRGTADGRPDPLRDYDRILYSSAWRRLSGVTQVVSPQDDYVYHDRAMHSLKVAQVGQRLAQSLLARTRTLVELVDPYVVAAAGMAHDLGHPPFGHAAEKELQTVLDGRVQRDGSATERATPLLADSFEGNAQTFRILATISSRKSTQEAYGLNLSWATLAAVLKYPWERENRPTQVTSDKWSVYSTERDVFEVTKRRAVSAGKWGTTRSIEAEVMDWADDVAYAVHDVEDFFRAGLLPLSELALHDETWSDFLAFAAERVAETLADDYDEGLFDIVCKSIRSGLPRGLYTGAKEQRYELHSWASRTITTLTAVRGSSGQRIGVRQGGLVVPSRLRHTAEVLKKIVVWSVIVRPALASAQHGQRRVVRELYFDLYDILNAAKSSGSLRDMNVLPPRLADYYRLLTHSGGESPGSHHIAASRAVVDFIASLTDKQATLLHRRINGNDVKGLSPQWLSL